MNPKRLRTCLFSLLLLTGAQCSPIVGEPTSTPTTPVFTTRMPIAVLPTSTPRQTPTPTPDLSRYSVDCVEVLDHLPPTIKLEGVLVVAALRLDSESYFLNLQTGEKKEKLLTGDRVSPDHSTLAKLNIVDGSSVLHLMDSSGNSLRVIPAPKDSVDLTDWIQDNLILFTVHHYDSDNPIIPSPFAILDLSSGKVREFLPEYPFFNDFPSEIKWGRYSFTRMTINHQLTHLVYPARERIDRDSSNRSLIMWDLQSNREVARVHQFTINSGVEAGVPAWSRDGTHFVTSAALRYAVEFQESGGHAYPLMFADDETENAFINIDDEYPYLGGDDLISVSLMGETKRLSFLTTNHIAYQEDWVWSPDESHIAFWLWIEVEGNLEGPQLAVLDVESGEVTNYCIPGYAEPIWSPDGRQLAIRQNPHGPFTFMLVDLEKRVAVSITDEESEVVGWMVQ